MRIAAPVPGVSGAVNCPPCSFEKGGPSTQAVRDEDLARTPSWSRKYLQFLILLTWHLLRRSDSDIPRPLNQEERSNRPNEAEIPNNQEPVKKEAGNQR
ncbi:hypothetical protein NDU88_002081 [Pleurodeles waltl]|uniref:Uncharacterized protein n=1 Tax=Pleurodeles waltl TaxID=8319 RepID=A0AAV7MQL2_PLEWA|nr:hypothetical protein NDU88_002081 [Pleurodeles waltl]